MVWSGKYRAGDPIEYVTNNIVTESYVCCLRYTRTEAALTLVLSYADLPRSWRAIKPASFRHENTIVTSAGWTFPAWVRLPGKVFCSEKGSRGSTQHNWTSFPEADQQLYWTG
jgi:hypothetical protein